MEWAFTQNGVICYNDVEVYYIGVNLKKKKAKKVKKIKFKVQKDQLFVKYVHGCPDPHFILICLSTDLDELILLTWDINHNKEMLNYSIEGDYSYISCPSTKNGLILSDEYYVNLDRGLINYYFDYDFTNYPWTQAHQGYKMDKKEETILYRGKLLMKEMYSESETLQKFLDGNFKLTEENITLDKIKIQIDGNTMLHLFCIDHKYLGIVMRFMEDHFSDGLASILMKNHNNETPLDLAIKYESFKTTELLLGYLSMLDERAYSRLIKIPELLEMNILSFHRYLDS